MQQLYYQLSHLNIFIFSLLLFILTSELGAGLAKLTKNKKISDLVPTACLGVLSLLMGFTFSMSLERYERRKELVMHEANAIGTTYLRTYMFNNVIASELRELFRQYVDIRIRYFEEPATYEEVLKIESLSRTMNNEIWKLSMKLSNQVKTPQMALYLTSLNEMIDLQEERLWAFDNRVPIAAHLLILFITLISLLTVGYSQHNKGEGLNISGIVLSFLFALVILIINDLDRPKRGLFREEKTEILRLRDSM